jgi:hypothetical protein
MDERAGYAGYSSDELESWIPAYLNGRLDPEQSLILKEWLKADPQAQEALLTWQQVQAAVVSQTARQPESRVWTELAGRIQPRSGGYRRTVASLFAGVGLALVSLLVLWLVIRPGVLLRWSISEPKAVSYRVYRAPLNSDRYVLVTVIPGQPGVREYAYLDSLFLPGQSYTYRVEGLAQGNVTLFSEAVHSPSASTFPGQFSILLASAMVGLLAARLFQDRQIIPGSLRRQRGLSRF